MNRLDHVVTNNLKKNKDRSNEAINNEPTFDTSNFNLSSSNSNPLPVVTVYLRRINKHRETTVSCITCLWDSGATNTMINRQTLRIMNSICGIIKYSIVQPMACTVRPMMLKYLFSCHNFLAAR